MFFSKMYYKILTCNNYYTISNFATLLTIMLCNYNNDTYEFAVDGAQSFLKDLTIAGYYIELTRRTLPQNLQRCSTVAASYVPGAAPPQLLKYTCTCMAIIVYGDRACAVAVHCTASAACLAPGGDQLHTLKCCELNVM